MTPQPRHPLFPSLTEKSAFMIIVTFLASTNGRIARAAAGLILIIAGVLLGGGWWALAVIGLVPLAAGIFDFCLLGPLMHRPMAGRRLRDVLP